MDHRMLEFLEAVRVRHDDQWGGWPIGGPGATPGVMRCMMERGGTPTGLHTQWMSEERLQPHGLGAAGNERGGPATEECACVEQGNARNMRSAERPARHVIQMMQEDRSEPRMHRRVR